jgi:hypothetical protein
VGGAVAALDVDELALDDLAGLARRAGSRGDRCLTVVGDVADEGDVARAVAAPSRASAASTPSSRWPGSAPSCRWPTSTSPPGDASSTST